MRVLTLPMLRTSVEAPPGCHTSRWNDLQLPVANLATAYGESGHRLWRIWSLPLANLGYSHSIVPGGFDVMS